MNEKITLDLCTELGQAVGSLATRILVGRDTRTSSVMLAHSIIAGLLSTGADVYDAGVVPTPTLAFCARKFDVGLIITASHNPPEYNGLKFWNGDGSAFNTQQMQAMERLVENNEFKVAGWRDIGHLSSYPNAIEEYMAHLFKNVKSSTAKVVVDCGGGATSHLTPSLLRQIGCDVITLSSEPTGFFPRDLELTKQSLGGLSDVVKKTNADLGIGLDGDGDRVGLVDDSADFVSGEQLMCLFAKNKKKVVVPVNASRAVDEVAKEVIRTKVGDVFISEKVKEINADLGCEPSGTFIFPEMGWYPDGILAGCRLIEMAEESSISNLIAELPEYPIIKGEINCENACQEHVIEKVKTELSKLEYDKLDLVDGVRAVFDFGWALVRPSGTEPKLRITVEADTKPQAEELYAQVSELVRRCKH